MIKLMAALGFLLLNFYTYHYMAQTPAIPPREHFEEFPMQLGEWTCPEQVTLTDDVWENLGATDILLCDFRRSDPPALVSVYVGYHATQVREEGGGSGENSIHPPAHCLPGSGWDIISNQTVPIDFAGLPEDGATAKRLVIAKGNARQLVYYWYQSRGRVESEDWKKIISTGLDRALRGRTDGALVRFTVPIIRGDEEMAEQQFRDLARRIVARLGPYVPV